VRGLLPTPSARTSRRREARGARLLPRRATTIAGCEGSGVSRSSSGGRGASSHARAARRGLDRRRVAHRLRGLRSSDPAASRVVLLERGAPRGARGVGARRPARVRQRSPLVQRDARAVCRRGPAHLPASPCAEPPCRVDDTESSRAALARCGWPSRDPLGGCAGGRSWAGTPVRERLAISDADARV